MRRARKILLWVAAIALLVPVVLVLGIFIAANSGPGRGLIERQAASLTGGQVILRGLSGRFPDALRLAHLEVRDRQGAWLSLDDVALDWSPSTLIGMVADIGRLSAAHLVLARLPVSEKPAAPAQNSQGGFSLPVRVRLHALSVARAEIGAPLAGKPAILALSLSGQFKSLTDVAAKLAADRLDSPGTYRLDGALQGATLRAAVQASEPPAGLIGGLAKLPDLGALALNGSIAGPRSQEAVNLNLSAGLLLATATGQIDLSGQSAALDVHAQAPAMSPRPDLAWQSVALTAHVQGKFTAPDVSGHAEIAGLHGGGASIGNLTLQASGGRGAVDAHAVLAGLVLPPPEPNLFAGPPLDLTVHAQLDKPDLPIQVRLEHPRLRADADIQAAGDLRARLHTVIPNLAPFAAIGKVDIQGSTEAVAILARHDGFSDVTVDGTARFTGGQAPLPTALGPTKFGATARLDGQNILVTRAVVDGAAAHLDTTGTDTDGKLAFAWHLVMSNLAAVSPQAVGHLEATGRADSQPAGLAVQAELKGDAGGKSVPHGPVTASLHATGLPADPAGKLLVQARLDGASLQLDAELSRAADGAFHAILHRADWKSLLARADLILAKGATVPTGSVQAKVPRLADLSPFVGQALGGSLDARIALADIGGKPDATITLQAADLSAGTSAVGRLSLTGHVRDPAGDPDAALTLTASGLSAQGVGGQATATLSGPQTALLLRGSANLSVRGAPARFAASARVDAKAKMAVLSTLSADYKSEQLALRAPARFGFGDATSVDRLALSLSSPGATPALLEVAGTVAPTLGLTASLRHVTPALTKPFAPQLNATGEISADAKLTGTEAAPLGTVRMQATNVGLKNAQFGFLAPGSLTAQAVLNGASARIDAHASAGPKLRASLAGSAPLRPEGTLALHLTLANDLSLLNPVLGATGQRAAGRLAVDATIGGTQAAPRLDGTATLSAGELQDYVQGVHLTGITARLAAAGDTLRIDQFRAQAGPGSLSASGSLGVLQSGLPVDIHLTAANARPLASDLLTATLDADLTVRGQAASDLLASGRIVVRQANINIPNGLPPSVAVLQVRRPGDKPPAANPPPSLLTRLAIEVDAPSRIFVRGHGLDSELGGKLTVAGTSAAPQIAGGFQMRRGNISVAGTTLNFSKGEVGFDGTSVTNKIDPTLDFVADTTSGGVTATLTVGGYADAPTIKLSSVPDLPQDEVLSHLLFGTSVKDLSAIQIAEIAGALAELSGVTGGGTDPLGAVRKGLGLDRLSVGGGSGSGTGATVEAGRYVARGVYVGARQATSGGGTAAEVQIDITRRLKAKAQLATGGGSVQGATPDDDPGSRVGLSYQFEY